MLGIANSTASTPHSPAKRAMTGYRQKQQHGNIFVILLAVIAMLVAAGFYKSHQKERQQQAKEQAAAETLAAAEKKKREEENAALQERLEQEQKQQDALSKSNKAVDAAYARWIDAVKVAESTSRIALSAPVTTLQSIRRETQELTVAPCMDAAKSALLRSMDTTIEGFFSFMTNKGELGAILAGGLLRQGAEQLASFNEQRKQCS